MPRRPNPYRRRSLLLSVVFHVALLALFWSTSLYRPEPMEFITYEIELVSPPPARQAEEPEQAREELVVERPDPEPTPPEPEVEEVIPVEEPPPEPEPEPEPPVDDPVEEEPPEVAEDPVVAATEEEVPEEEPEVTGEDLNIRIQGLQRDYPEYYNNIIRQIRRCFRWTRGGNWQTTVFFNIDRQGNAEDIDWISRSGNTSFDFQSLEAIECAGREGGFGALPEDIPFDRFPVSFSFRPMGETLIQDLRQLLPDMGTPTEVTFHR